MPGLDGVSLHLEAITDEGVRHYVDQYMRDDPFGSKTAIKAPLTDASTASDVIVEAVARHAHEQEQSKKRVLGKRTNGQTAVGSDPVVTHEAADYMFAEADEYPCGAPDMACQKGPVYPMYTDTDRIIEVDGTDGMCKEPLHSPLVGGWFWYNIFTPGPLQVIGSKLNTGSDKKKKKKKKKKEEEEDCDTDQVNEKTVVVCVTGVNDLNELHDWLIRYCGVDNGRFTKAKVAHGSTSRVSMRLGRYSVVCIGDVPLADLLTLHRLKFPEVPFQAHAIGHLRGCHVPIECT